MAKIDSAGNMATGESKQNIENGEDLENLMANIAKISEKWGEVANTLSQTIYEGKLMPNAISNISNQSIFEAFTKLQTSWVQNPEQLMQKSVEWLGDYLQLVNQTTFAFCGLNNAGDNMGGTHRHQTLEARESGNKQRNDVNSKVFQAEEWQENPAFAFIKNYYLLTSKSLRDIIESTTGVDEETRNKLKFFLNLYIEAISPVNFPFTNPKVIKEAINSNGENFIKGLSNLQADLSENVKSAGSGLEYFMPKNFNADAFKVGENLAITKGDVIYKNELFELISYTPTTDDVYAIPLFIIPPWINKYYILDLRQQNSFVKFLVDKGFRVYLISWINPESDKIPEDEKPFYQNLNFEDYVKLGAMEAYKQVLQHSGAKKLNALGYCIGGTLLSILANKLMEHGKNEAKGNNRGGGNDILGSGLNSITFLTTLLDFSEPGDIGAFFDKSHFEKIKNSVIANGFFSAKNMASVFSMLRARDMIFNSVVNNYLLGKQPVSFDILSWNADATSLPAKMYASYLENFYYNNLLTKPNALNMLDVGVDLSRVNVPAYVLAAQKDHIVPWQSAYNSAKLLGSFTEKIAEASRFILSGSGHVAGVVNPPNAGKYGYYKNDAPNILTKTFDDWFNNASKQEGSWWEDYADWLKQGGFMGAMIGAKSSSNNARSNNRGNSDGGSYVKMADFYPKPLYPAPGQYVFY